MKDINLLETTFKYDIENLLSIYKELGLRFTVTSTRRTLEENRELQRKGEPAADNSNHLWGGAIDIEFIQQREKEVAISIALKKGFRVLSYKNHPGLIHIDKGRHKQLEVEFILPLLIGGIIGYVWNGRA